MAIQTIDLKVPNGDTPRSANTKINANFSNTSHAASRLVGEADGNLIEVGTFGLGRTTGNNLVDISGTYKNGFYTGSGGASVGYPVDSYAAYNSLVVVNRATFTNILSFGRNGAEVIAMNDGLLSRYFKIYGTNNTTLDSNGLLKPSSPVLRVFNDRIEGNDDGDVMGATYTKNGVGDYTITGTTGLRTDGWYVVIPNDMNGNPKVAITLDDTDGVITLKTYVRIFDMSTFKFVPDLEQPLDIPDGRWIDLRFNDLPIDNELPQ